MSTICGPTMMLLNGKPADNIGHLYTIPVEWGYTYISNAYTDGRTGRELGAKIVTKLRCQCGEEISR